MDVIEFLNNKFNSVIREYNNTHNRSYCTPGDLQRKKETVEYMIIDMEVNDEYGSLYYKLKTLLHNINIVLNQGGC